MLIERNVTEDYKSKIVGVIDEIANKEKLLVMLTDICLPQVSPYDYDSKYRKILLYIIYLLEFCALLDYIYINILNFMLCYLLIFL